MILDYSKYELNKRELFLYYSMAIGTLLFVSWLFFNRIAVGLVLLPAVAFGKKFAARFLCERRLGRLKTEFIDFLYSLSSSVATGMHMREAMREAREEMRVTSPKSLMLGELNEMLAKMEASNTSERELLIDFADRSSIDDLKSFVEGYYIARDSGGDLIRTINRSVQVLTDKLLIERDMKTLIAQKVFEGRLIAMLPVAIILLLRTMSPGYLEPLYTTGGGRIIMLMALFTMGFAFYYSNRLQKVVFEDTVESALPEFISRLILLLGSGMVLETALSRIAEEESGTDNKLLLEFQRVYTEARSANLPVLKKFREYAISSGSRELIRFCGILISSADKGTELTEKLERESEFMWHSAKKQTEEKSRLAETKMTLPMSLMLVVLITITTAPAIMTL